jgi:hypothetical protein
MILGESITDRGLFQIRKNRAGAAGAGGWRAVVGGCGDGGDGAGGGVGNGHVDGDLVQVLVVEGLEVKGLE